MVAPLALPDPARSAIPPLTADDWAVKAPADDPNAPMVVLFRRAEFQLMDLRRQHIASSMRLEQRLKVLTTEGLHGGELEIAHGAKLRLQSLTGRTLLSDGRVLPLSADAKFERRLSSRDKSWVTAVAFPGVAVGAILEYEAVLRFESVLLLEPWYLSSHVPVLYSEVVFELPRNLQAVGWGRDPFQAGVQTETSQGITGTRLRAWARNLPGVPFEPFAPPFADLSTQYGIITTAYNGDGESIRLFDNWQHTCERIAEWDYSPARHKDRGVKQRARELAGSLRDPRQKAEALYRFVRDQIRTEHEPGVRLAEETSLGEVLSSGGGDYAEKALLLQVMLDAVGVEAQLVWANERSSGLPQLDLANPDWFERVLVAVDLPSGRAFLDPAERELAFGALSADVEGGQALLFDTRKPELVTLPSLAAEANRRRATLALAVDDEGQVGGTGEIVFTGHHAVTAIAAAEPSKLAETWQKWLKESLPGFQVDEVEATPAVEAGEMHLRWKMTQPLEEALGDEVTLLPTRPLGPVSQVFALPPAQRLTPVLLPFADRDEVSLELNFPAGWRVETLPPNVDIKNKAGSIHVTSTVDYALHVVHYERRIDVFARESSNREGYAQFQALYAAAERHDAKALALARR